MLTIFCLSLAVIVYVYFGYPLLLWLGALGRKQPPAARAGTGAEGDPFPALSILVAAHNEELAIGAKIANLLASRYPQRSLEILIGDDGSSDRTAAIARSFAANASAAIKVISSPVQQRKSAMQNQLAAASSGEVLVFTDADCLIPPGALESLVGHFADARIGLVTARPRFENEREAGIVANESLYLRYETWLRNEESARGLLAVASGSLFAMRRSLWRPLDAAHGDDFVFPLRMLQAGMRNVLDASVVAVTRLSQDRPAAMWRMKTRIISKDFRALLSHREVLNPLRYGGVAAGLWSHKLLRWLIPYFLLALGASNLFLLAREPFGAFAALQAIFYVAAAVGFAGLRRFGRALIACTVPLSFCVVNLAALFGTLHCCFGGTFGQWKPERGASPAVAAGPAAAAPAVVAPAVARSLE